MRGGARKSYGEMVRCWEGIGWGLGGGGGGRRRIRRKGRGGWSSMVCFVS